MVQTQQGAASRKSVYRKFQALLSHSPERHRDKGARIDTTPIQDRRVIVATATSAGLFYHLPVELVIKVLLSLDVTDIVQCRNVCHWFRKVIDLTPEIQYAIELAVTGARDAIALPLHIVGVPRRLELLSEFGNSWKRLDMVSKRVTLTEALPYVGNVFMEPFRTGGLPNDNTLGGSKSYNAMRCHAISPVQDPESQGSKVEVETWATTFEFFFETYVVDPAQNLIILLERRSQGYDDRDRSYIVRPAALSDGTVYEDGIVTVPVPNMHSDHDSVLDIFGDILGIGIDGHQESDLLHDVVLVNWRVGEIISKLSRNQHFSRTVNSDSFALISESAFLLGVTLQVDDRFVNAVELWTFTGLPANADADTPIPSPTHSATFEFPRLQRDVFSRSEMRFRQSYRGSYSASENPNHRRPFTTSPESAILCIDRIEARKKSGASASLMVIVHSATFLRYLPSSYSSSTPRLARTLSRTPYLGDDGALDRPQVYEWDSWGPTAARVFEDKDNFDVKAVHGPRILLEDNLLDFNILSLRRDLVQADSSLANLSPACPRPPTAARKLLPRIGRCRDHDLEDVPIPGFPGKVVVQPSLIPKGDMFQRNVCSMLPYRTTPVMWSGERPEKIYPGDVWAFLSKKKRSRKWDCALFDV